MKTETSPQAIPAILDAYLGKRVILNCQVAVCIFGAVLTLENGHGFCRYECVSGEVRIGIAPHTIASVKENLDGTLTINIQ